MGITITTALVMGFSASLSCMAWCVPVIVPYTGAGEKSSLKSGFITSLLFTIGRLFSYAGLLAVFLAMKAIITLSPVNNTGRRTNQRDNYDSERAGIYGYIAME